MSTNSNNNKSSIFSKSSSSSIGNNNEGTGLVVNKKSSSSSSPPDIMLNKHISKTFSESFDDNDEEVVVDAEDHHRCSTKIHHHQLPNVQLLVETNHVPRTTGTPFFFETIIQRDPKTKQKFILSLQTTYNGTFPIYCAEKASSGGDRDGGSSSYNLRSMVQKNQRDNDDPGGRPHSNIILGTVMKQQQEKKKKKKKKNNDSSTVTYEVIHHDRTTGQQDPSSSTSSKNTVMAVIDYEYIHKVQHFIKGGRPRYAQIKIMGRDDEDVESKEPNRDATGQRSLDFNGRGGTNAMVSTKNMQLVNNNNTTNGNGQVVLQIIKWNENEFHLDFSYPFDAFHAFAFALAQFDFKNH